MSTALNTSSYDFSSLRGQKQFIQEVQAHWQNGTLAQALLFTGPEGSGRKTLALALAKLILCQHSGSTACGQCPACRYVEASSHPDLHTLFAEPGQIIKVDQLREEVIRNLPVRPQISARSVYIVEGDKLNEQGQNVLLKSLEEPPPYAYFILTAGNCDQLLPTVCSRLAELPLEGWSREEILDILKDRGFHHDLEFIAAFANHLPGQALALAAREDFSELRQDILRSLSALNATSYLDLAAKEHRHLLAHKDDFPIILRMAQTFYRDLARLLIDPQCEPKTLLNGDKAPLIKASAATWRGSKESLAAALERLQRIDQTLQEMQKSLTYHVNFEILSWTLLARLKRFSVPGDAGRKDNR